MPGDDVFTLRVLEEVAVGRVLTGCGVAGERDAGAGVVALVAEHHRLDVDRGAEVVVDLLHAPVDEGALAVPGAEHRLDGEPQLGRGVLRELDARLGQHDGLEPVGQPLEVVGRELRVGVDPALLAELLERVLELRAVDVEDDLGEHLHEAAVRVVREARVVGLLGQAPDRHVVEPEVEDRVHHPRHRERRSRSHRHQQRVGGVAELLAHLRLERGERGGDLVHEAGRDLVVGGHVGPARVGADRESGRNGETELGHLGEVGALAPQQELLLLGALLEGVHVRHCTLLLERGAC